MATTDKVEYFGNLIRNGYLQGKHIDGSIFDEYIHILNTMSYREIQYLVEYKNNCEDSSKRGKSTKHIMVEHIATNTNRFAMNIQSK